MFKIGVNQPLPTAFLHNAHNVLKSVPAATRKKINTNVNSSCAQDLFRNCQLNEPKPTIKMLSIIKINAPFLCNHIKHLRVTPAPLLAKNISFPAPRDRQQPLSLLSL
jgi:hypothetical protein